MTENQLKDAFDKRKMIDPADSRFGEMMCSAVRYALGRMTCIVSDTADYISHYLSDMDTDTLRKIEKDIKQHAEWNDLGMSIDRIKWLHLRNEILAELAKRDENN